MNITKIKAKSLMLVFVVFCSACNSGVQESSEQQGQVVNAVEQPIHTTVENGKRLSEDALKSYLPEVLGGLNKSGDPVFSTSDPDPDNGGIRLTADQVYSGNAGTIYLHIRDDADHQASINSMQRGMSYQNFPFSQTYQNDKGWYITKSFEFRAVAEEDTLVTSRTISIRNSRFFVEYKYSPKRGEPVPEYDYLMSQFDHSHLPTLFELEIPQGEVVEKQAPSLALNCDEILPAEEVAEFCNVSGITANPTSFEQDDNCNRRYRSSGDFDELIFILSQYNETGPAGNAVTMKINDTTMDTRKVNNLGDDAVMVTVGEDLYLTVAQETFLVELRSYPKNFCGTEENLSALAKEVLVGLPE